MSLHTQEDGVRCEAGQAAFNIRLAPQFLCFSIQVIQCPHRLLKLLLVNLKEGKKNVKSPEKPFIPSLDRQGAAFYWMGVDQGSAELLHSLENLIPEGRTHNCHHKGKRRLLALTAPQHQVHRDLFTLCPHILTIRHLTPSIGLNTFLSRFVGHLTTADTNYCYFFFSVSLIKPSPFESSQGAQKFPTCSFHEMQKQLRKKSMTSCIHFLFTDEFR